MSTITAYWDKSRKCYFIVSVFRGCRIFCTLPVHILFTVLLFCCYFLNFGLLSHFKPVARLPKGGLTAKWPANSPARQLGGTAVSCPSEARGKAPAAKAI